MTEIPRQLWHGTLVWNHSPEKLQRVVMTYLALDVLCDGHIYSRGSVFLYFRTCNLNIMFIACCIKYRCVKVNDYIPTETYTAYPLV